MYDWSIFTCERIYRWNFIATLPLCGGRGWGGGHKNKSHLPCTPQFSELCGVIQWAVWGDAMKKRGWSSVLRQGCVFGRFDARSPSKVRPRKHQRGHSCRFQENLAFKKTPTPLGHDPGHNPAAGRFGNPQVLSPCCSAMDRCRVNSLYVYSNKCIYINIYIYTYIHIYIYTYKNIYMVSAHTHHSHGQTLALTWAIISSKRFGRIEGVASLFNSGTTNYTALATSYRGILLVRNNPSLGPYRRLIPRNLWWS